MSRSKRKVTIKKKFSLIFIKLIFLKRTLGIAVLILGVFLVSSGPVYKVYSNKVDKEQSKIEVQSTEELNDSEVLVNPIVVDGKLLEGKIYEEQVPKKIVIPSISIDVDLKPAKVVNGFWEVFEDSGSYGLGSGVPGESGNAVIFAHARVGYFLPLRKIKMDDKIYVLATEKWHEYKVSEVKEVKPEDISVIKSTDDEVLTLYTCSGYADSKRLIVLAKKV